jgi:hypothetical protein
MNRNADELPTRIEQGGIKIQGTDWHDMNVAHIRFPKGADATPLLEGLPQNLCQCPHWGYVLRGTIHVRYADGREETVKAGSVYFWPAGHTVRTSEDYEAIELSPAREMETTLAHLERKLDEAAAED